MALGAMQGLNPDLRTHAWKIAKHKKKTITNPNRYLRETFQTKKRGNSENSPNRGEGCQKSKNPEF